MRARLGNGSGLCCCRKLPSAKQNTNKCKLSSTKMSACCVFGCKNRHSSTSNLKFYRIPSGQRPFQANRRRLWLQAIRQGNGIIGELKGNARICGAHFISGEASMDHDSPDFVPSVFTCSETSHSLKKTNTRSYKLRRRLRFKVNPETEGTTTPPRVDSPVDLQSSALMETESELSDKIQKSLNPSPAKTISTSEESKPLTNESEGTSSVNNTPSSFHAPAGIIKLGKMSPIVLLKTIVTPAGGFQCEMCSQYFVSVLQLVKHKQMHEEEKRSISCEVSGKTPTDQADFTEHQLVHTEEPSFPCNMCDRSFTTSRNLKRHKLLHVKDGRKCPVCGVLFCRRHNHILFLPQTEPLPESEQDSSIVEPPNVASSQMAENSTPEEFAPKEHLSKKSKVSPPATHTKVIPEVPVPGLQKPFPLQSPPRPVRSYIRTSATSPQFKVPLPTYPVPSIQPRPPQLELPASLKIFSPQHLTSAFIEVKRNYDYILSKPVNVKKDIVKEEQCQLPLSCQVEQSVKQVKKERIAYDLEIDI